MWKLSAIWLLLWLSPAGAQETNLKVKEYEPIVLTVEIPPNTDDHKSVVDWRCWDKAFKLRPSADGAVVHAWAPPKAEAYEVEATIWTTDFVQRSFTKQSFFFVVEVTGQIRPHPTPTPIPTPTPTPTPPPPPAGEFADKVALAIASVPSAAREAKVKVTHGDGHTTEKRVRDALGDIYQEVAEKAGQNPEQYTPAAMIDEVKSSNASILPLNNLKQWKPFFDGLAAAFVEEKLAAEDLAGHIERFSILAKALYQ